MIEQTPPSNAALAAFPMDATVAHEIARRDAGQQDGGRRDPSRAAITVDHVSDQKRCYPGDRVSFYTRVRIHAAIPGFQVRVQVPAGLEIDTYRGVTDEQMPIFYSMMQAAPRELIMLPGPDGEPFPLQVPNQPTRALEPSRMAQEMVWRVMEPQEAGATHDFMVTSLVLPIHHDLTLFSTATLEILGEEGGQVINTETLSVAVYRSGRYLEYLPSLYEQDDFMGRFLMLFESFWRPIEQQIDEIHNYFDADMTPARFLPWLASWFDLLLDDNWNESQQRELLNIVIWLYRRRGTRVALQRYLEIFTQEPVEILEKRAKNMSLGPSSRLGVGVALGTSNQPHTFTVKLKLRPIPPPAELDEEEGAREVARLEKQRLALIHRMIMAEKPAHTSYRLEIQAVTG
jgi:phage tail-like protein